MYTPSTNMCIHLHMYIYILYMCIFVYNYVCIYIYATFRFPPTSHSQNRCCGRQTPSVVRGWHCNILKHQEIPFRQIRSSLEQTLAWLCTFPRSCILEPLWLDQSAERRLGFGTWPSHSSRSCQWHRSFQPGPQDQTTGCRFLGVHLHLAMSRYWKVLWLH